MKNNIYIIIVVFMLSVLIACSDKEENDIVVNDIENVDEPDENLLLFNDFSVNPLGTTNENGVTWNSGTTNIRVNPVTQVLEMEQLGSPDLSNDAKTELRFNMTEAQPELWISFKLKLPTNFEHRDNTPSSENNKFLAVWMDAYSQFGTGSTMFWEFWQMAMVDQN